MSEKEIQWWADLATLSVMAKDGEEAYEKAGELLGPWNLEDIQEAKDFLTRQRDGQISGMAKGEIAAYNKMIAALQQVLRYEAPKIVNIVEA